MVQSLDCNTEWVLLLIVNSTITNHSGQSFYLWFTKNFKYCSNSWFIYLVCLSICRWNDINNFVLISNTLFSFLVNSVANCGSLSEITLFNNLYNSYTLSLNNLASLSANINKLVYVLSENIEDGVRTTSSFSLCAVPL